MKICLICYEEIKKKSTDICKKCRDICGDSGRKLQKKESLQKCELRFLINFLEKVIDDNK